MTTYPAPTDPVSALTRPQGAAEAHSSDHGRLIHQAENPVHYGARGNDSTDDTAAFLACIAAMVANNNHAMFVPPGIFIVDGDQIEAATADFHGYKWFGSGMRNTVIKAKSGSSCAWKMQGSQRNVFYDISWYGQGSGQPEMGLRNTSNSQANTYVHCSFENAAIAGSFEPVGGGSQNDKHTFIGCMVSDNTVGMDFRSLNGQGITWIGGSFDSNSSVACKVQNGWFSMYGGMVQGPPGVGTCFQLGEAGNAAQALTLDGIITEGPDIDIDVQNMMAPANITIRNSYLQGASYIVKNAGGGRLLTEANTFNNGVLQVATGKWYSREDNINIGGVATATYTLASPSSLAYIAYGAEKFTYVGGTLIRYQNATGIEDVRTISAPASPAVNYVRYYTSSADGKPHAKTSGGVDTAFY